MKFLKVPTDDERFRMATWAEAGDHHQDIKMLLDEWTIALLDGGKVDGRGYGGEVHKGDFKDQCGEKIVVVEGDSDGKPADETDEVGESIGNLGEALAGLLLVGMQMGELTASFQQLEKIQKEGMEKMEKLTQEPKKEYEEELKKQGGVKQYKTLTKEKDGDFHVPEGWNMIPMMELIPYMDPSKNPGDNPELSKFMKHIFTSGEGEGFPESKIIITNKKVVLKIDGKEVRKVERQADRSFKIEDGWIEVPKADETVQKMVDLVATRRELELFQKGDLLFIAKKADGEPDYKAVRSDEGGKFDIPSGWSVVGMMDPAMPTLMPRFMTGPQDVDDFNNGKMVIITNKAGAGAKEDWVVVEKKDGGFQAPPGYQIIEMDESNFGEYVDRIQHLLNLSVGEKINEGTVKFALKGENKSSGSVSHYKMIAKEKDGDFNVPEGWNTIPMLQLVPYMDPTNDPGDNPELSNFMKEILSSGAALGFPESKAIITNKKVALELDGMEVHKIEREEDRSFKIQEGWVELPKSDENIQKMINLVSTKRELELFQKGDLLFVAQKGIEQDGEPDYKAVRSDEGGKFDIPSGWSVVGMMDPAMPTLMPRFITGPQDVDDFNNGKMVIITNKEGAGAKEDWVVVEKKDGGFQAPPGYQIIEMDESNFGEYMPRVQHLLNKSVAEKINSGSVKFALKD